jgi:hypothetical protein
VNHRYYLPSVIFALIALTVVYPWTLIPIAVVAVWMIFKGPGKRRYPVLRSPDERTQIRARRYAQFKVEQSVRRVEEARESTARLNARHRMEGAIPPAPRTARPCPCRECTSRRAKQQQDYKIRPLSVDELARMSPSQRDFLQRVKAESTRPAVKPCTEGGPCKIGHRRVVHDVRGVRVASLCTKCGRHEYWQPFIDLGVS